MEIAPINYNVMILLHVCAFNEFFFKTATLTKEVIVHLISYVQID